MGLLHEIVPPLCAGRFLAGRGAQRTVCLVRRPCLFMLKGSAMLSQYLLIGQVLKPQGVYGQVKIRPDTNDPARYLSLQTVYIKDGEQFVALKASDAAVRDGFAYLILGDDVTRDDAEKRRDLFLYVAREDAVPLKKNEYFICDMIGCTVYDTKENTLGTITDVLQPGANDVYVIKTPRGEMLVPAIRVVVKDVDVENRRVVLDEERLPEVAVMDDEA